MDQPASKRVKQEIVKSSSQSGACKPIDLRKFVGLGGIGMMKSEPRTHTSNSSRRRSGASIRTGQNRALLKSQSLPLSKQRIGIAISGSPASGKTTLAYLLAAVFEGVTLQDTGFAGAQSMYPLFNAKVEEHQDRNCPITKVILVDQNEYIKPVSEWPKTRWSELFPHSPVIEALNTQDIDARALAGLPNYGPHQLYWGEAYKANIGVDPAIVSNSLRNRFSRLVYVSPKPIRISKQGPNHCRGSIAWEAFGRAMNGGLTGQGNEKGTLETEKGRDRIAEYLSRTDPNTGAPLVTSENLEHLRERVRKWVREETAQNDLIGFPGRAFVNGRLREIVVLEGPLLFLLTVPALGAGGENLMKVCDVKLFLPTLEKEAIQRYFGQSKYMDPCEVTRKQEDARMFGGYFSEVIWKEYKSEHAWLFEKGNATKPTIEASPKAHHYGIKLREFYGAHLKTKGYKYAGKKWADQTLDWALQVILDQLSVEEAQGRQAFLIKTMSDGGDRGDAVIGTNNQTCKICAEQDGAVSDIKQ